MGIVANGINISNCGVGIMSVGGGKVCVKDAKFNDCEIDVVAIEDKDNTDNKLEDKL